MYTIISADQRILTAITKIRPENLTQLDIQQLAALTAPQETISDGGTYRLSMFNYHVGNSSEHLLYNTLYHSLVRMDTADYKEYLSLHTPNADFRQEMLDSGLWVAACVDERKQYLQLASICTRSSHRPLNVTITTTLRCNARCSYCYETGVMQKDFARDQIDALFAFLSSQDTSWGVNLNWFGGEPLMNTVLMDEVTDYLTVREIPFSSYLITNGSLLTDQIIDEKLKKWHIHNMQVTIDGTWQEYLRRKAFKRIQDGDFYRLLYRISQAAQAGVYNHIRLNIDSRNIDEILAVVPELETYLGRHDNVVYYPAFLTGVGSRLTEEQKVDIIYQMLTVMKDPKKLTAGTKFYSLPRPHACMREDPRSFSIDVDGNIYNCEHMVGKSQKAIGSLRKGLFAEENTRMSQQLLQEECQNCVFLPKCMGGCQSNRTAGECPCLIERYLLPAYLRFLLD